MFKEYFQLIRIPGIFTAFSNVLIGYFFAINQNPDFLQLPYLLVTSGMLFSAGMILNDYFDFNIDKKERPNRPLPSGKIPKQNALFLGVLFLIIANIFALVVGQTSLIISLIMTGLIICYNFKLKIYSVLGISLLSGIRFLNVVLGFSIIPISFEVVQWGIPVAIFVAGISILAKNEAGAISRIPIKLNRIFNFAAIISVVILIVNYSKIESIVFLGIFSFFSLNPLIKGKNSEKKTQMLVTSQLISIILLDATLVAVGSEFYYAILISLLSIPAFLITRRLYLT